jgi:hypothetical protein
VEKIMSKTNDTTKPRELNEAELDVVSGGRITNLRVLSMGLSYGSSFQDPQVPPVVLVHEHPNAS